MKKLLVFLAVLFVSVISSACINNFAIQELNTKAKEYLDKGDYAEAIKRLESSVDLDGSVFETRYNLAVAYTNKEEYSKAIGQLNEALKLDPTSADAYYTLGVAFEGEADKKIEKEPASIDEVADEKNAAEENQISSEDAEYVVKKLEEAVNAYKKYLEISDTPADADTVKAHIAELEAEMKEYSAFFENNAGGEE